MTATTIKVSPSTRDRLKGHAQRAGMTLGAFVESLLDEADRQERFAAMRGAIAEMSPDQRNSYETERDEWLDADLS